MCQSLEFQGYASKRRINSLKIKAFFVRFSGLKSCKPLPDSLTLLYLPRINGAEFAVDGSKIRPDSSAFLTLHRVVNVKTKKGEAIFGSRSRVSASGGVRFEVFMRDERVLDGIFRKDKKEEWKLECECGLESAVVVSGGGAAMAEAEADVCVAVEGHVVLSGRVGMVSNRKKTRRKEGFDRLEVIPEEIEEAVDETTGYCCECGGSDGGDSEEVCGPEVDLEGVRWAMDVGIWVMCFGLGYFVSKASAQTLRRLRLL